ncbi:hypothetical protein [Sinomonas sp. G460-2]|uniref:hypothetical protein n=1 Tax=Sinomonas sp. G460-2 TaxID=3393464 RepID=UPI0039F12A56
MKRRTPRASAPLPAVPLFGDAAGDLEWRRPEEDSLDLLLRTLSIDEIIEDLL